MPTAVVLILRGEIMIVFSIIVTLMGIILLGVIGMTLYDIAVSYWISNTARILGTACALFEIPLVISSIVLAWLPWV